MDDDTMEATGLIVDLARDTMDQTITIRAGNCHDFTTLNGQLKADTLQIRHLNVTNGVYSDDLALLLKEPSR